ncbi:MAG: 2,3-bisphosphoglycerate-independent phosphoglycerate mutase [Candidatus Pacebacteria bacterium]|nr:2,3-bisphosphoglycerate-independent phosphoglycerate mutase [Candidatus Paceibacterota bacterium]
MKKILLTILDGLGDINVEELGNKTPLEAANTPNLDYMAENGINGLMKPFKFFYEKYPTSEGAHIGLFGYKDYFLGRGPYEAAGINMPLYEGDIALRVNFSTIKDGIIIDRRAGRIKDTEELIEALSNIVIKGIKFDIKRSNGHRAVLVLRGNNLSSNITSNDPGEEGKEPFKIESTLFEGDFTAEILNEYLKRANEILSNLEFNKKRDLPANYLLLRGAGQFKRVYPFKDNYGLNTACVAGGGLYKGIAKMIGMDVINVPNTTADIDTDLWDKFEAVKKALQEYDFVFLHIKGTDVCSHDGRYEDKKKFIEEIDRYFKDLIDIDNLLIIVTADHSTPCELKEHSNDPVPILIYGNGKDNVSHFSENEAKNGELGVFEGSELMNKVLKLNFRTILQ